LVAFYDDMQAFSDCTLDLGWTHPNATLVDLYASLYLLKDISVPLRPDDRRHNCMRTDKPALTVP